MLRENSNDIAGKANGSVDQRAANTAVSIGDARQVCRFGAAGSASYLAVVDIKLAHWVKPHRDPAAITAQT